MMLSHRAAVPWVLQRAVAAEELPDFTVRSSIIWKKLHPT